MANKKRQQKSSKRPQKSESGQNVSTSPTIKTEEGAEQGLRAPADAGQEGTPTTRSKRIATRTRTERDDSFSGGMSLDVLAQVATEHLEKEPVPQKRPPSVASAKRNVKALDLLGLEQIRNLSEKVLVGMFSELDSNEITRNYSYTCYLMPDQCTQTFNSFGNENKAQMMIKSHLLTHIAELVDKGDINFAAEPIQARKRRIAAEAAAQRKAKRKLKEWASESSFTSVKSTEKSARKSAAKPSRSAQKEVDEEFMPLSVMSQLDTSSEDDERRQGFRKRGSRPAKKPLARRFTHKKTHTLSKPPSLIPGIQDEHVDVETTPEVSQEVLIAQEEVKHEAENTIAENEQFVLELLSKAQPFHDHSYTTVFGKRHGVETLQLDAETLDELTIEDDTARTSGLKYKTTQEAHGCLPEPQEGMSKTLTLRVNAGSVPTVNNVHIPIIRLARIPVAPDGTPLISAEEVVIQEDDENYTGLITSSAQKPYPPMPKSELARKGKVAVPEEELSSDEDGMLHPTSSSINTATLVMAARAQKDTKRKMLSHGTADWERKLALKCIRDLRGKKRDEEPLVCKICKDKEFTATATLMYHYRSHAGIKPFVCLICHTTFTRQHSLNYHMLIHNNQSRFTCKDCGRKFRHPSHFKEHLRRHTGETPFHCADCPLRFKTRNTYKRHLKTRHGKLLTADGIKSVNHPAEEYYIQIPAPQSSTMKQPGESEEDVDIDGDEDYVQEEEEEEEDEDEDIEVEPEERIETVTTQPHTAHHAQELAQASQHLIEQQQIQQLQQQLQYQPPPVGAGSVIVEQNVAATTQLTTSDDNRLLQFCAQVVNQEMM